MTLTRRELFAAMQVLRFDRRLALVRLFACGPQSAPALAAELGVPSSTLRDNLRALERAGLVFVRDRRWQLTPAVQVQEPVAHGAGSRLRVTAEDGGYFEIARQS